MLATPACAATTRIIFDREWLARRFTAVLASLNISQRKFCVHTGLSRTRLRVLLNLTPSSPTVGSIAECHKFTLMLGDEIMAKLDSRPISEKIIEIFNPAEINDFLRTMRRHPDFSLAAFSAANPDIQYAHCRAAFSAAEHNRNIAIEPVRSAVITSALEAAAKFPGTTHSWCAKLSQLSKCKLV